MLAVRFPTRAVPLGRGNVRPAGSPPGVVGILNVPPDSFSDGGALRTIDDCVRAAERGGLGAAADGVRGAEGMVGGGASVLDVGGESTSPAARAVSLAEELERV